MRYTELFLATNKSDKGACPRMQPYASRHVPSLDECLIFAARTSWDDAWLFVAAELTEPQPWATLTDHDSVIFNDPDFEVRL